MNRYLSTLILIALFGAGCKSYSKYPIDKAPSVAIDTNLLGMWRCVEDTDKANFIEVQNFNDVYGSVEKRYGSMENYLAKEIQQWEEGIAKGNWDSTNDRSIVDLRWAINSRKCLYYLTYFDYHGLNPHYEAWDAYLSTVNKKLFLNLLYWNEIADNKREEGYLLLQVIKMARDTVVTAIVADQAMKNLQSSKEVRSRVTARLNDKRFYSDTMHFYKIKRFHGTQKIAIKLANQK